MTESLSPSNCQQWLLQLLLYARTAQASDIHLGNDQAPVLRIHGELEGLNQPRTDRTSIQACLKILRHWAQPSQAETAFDFGFNTPNLQRYRAHCFEHQHGWAIAIRILPDQLKTLDELGAPAVIAGLTRLDQGLVLVTGPTGSGKSTTLAALIEYMNTRRRLHIITLEDPIEYIHQNALSLIRQRDIRLHAGGTEAALKDAMRQDPDVIVVSELRDLPAMRVAISAAETGHLVMAGLHARDAATSIERLIDCFGPDEQPSIRSLLAGSIQAVISQSLCPTADEKSRIALFEVMIGTPAIRHLIREQKTSQIQSVMQTSSASGMQTFEQHMRALVQAKLIIHQPKPATHK